MSSSREPRAQTAGAEFAFRSVAKIFDPELSHIIVIRLGDDIELELPRRMAVIAVLNVHSSGTADLIEPDKLRLSLPSIRDEYMDNFGNRCTRIPVQQGPSKFMPGQRQEL